MKFLNQKDLGTLPKILISSFLTIFFFYSMPSMLIIQKINLMNLKIIQNRF